MSRFKKGFEKLGYRTSDFFKKKKFSKPKPPSLKPKKFFKKPN